MVLYVAVLTCCAGVVFNDDNIGEGIEAYALRCVVAMAVAACLSLVYARCGVWRSIAGNIDENQ